MFSGKYNNQKKGPKTKQNKANFVSGTQHFYETYLQNNRILFHELEEGKSLCSKYWILLTSDEHNTLDNHCH